MIQRLLDILFSFVALLVLFPILIPVAIILRVTGEGEVFYVQERVGRHGKRFGLLKFATMLKNSPNIGAGEITLTHDPRVLPVGKFLRKSKINELPQVWNIFIGDMSIVGPRPMVPNTYAKYPKRDQDILNTVRPGLTGIGSIVFRDEEKLLDAAKNPREFYDENIIPYKSSLEVWFVNNNSLRVYFCAIFLTALALFFPSNKAVERLFPSLPSLPKILEH